MWRIHRAIGMGGDKLVAAVAGDAVEREHGDEVRDRWEKEYDEIIDETGLLPGAQGSPRRTARAWRRRRAGQLSIPKHARHAFDLLDADDLADTATTAEDAEESKPDPELVQEALSRLEGGRACVIGDSVWDVEAAKRAGLPAYGVLTGGTGRAELETAGAIAVYDDPRPARPSGRLAAADYADWRCRTEVGVPPLGVRVPTGVGDTGSACEQ